MYQCTRCGYLSKRKYNLINHLKRKKICEPLLLDINRCELLKELSFDNRRKREKQVLSNTMSPGCNPNVTRMSPECNPNVTRMSPENNSVIYNCRYCNKPFKYRQGRSRHEKHRCKKNPGYIAENEALQETVRQLQEQVALLTNQQLSQSNLVNKSHNNINKNNTNSFNTINLSLNTLGNENIKYLKTFLLKNIKNIIKCKTDFFIEYVKQKHFHPEHIENHNVVSFNQRSNSMYGYMNQDTHLERRLKNSMSLILYKNIIDDVSGFIEKQLQREQVKKRNRSILDRAADTMEKQDDAICDYENKNIEDTYNTQEKKTNIKIVDTHLKEIENTIYNESKNTYGDISAYYLKHNTQTRDFSNN